MANRFFSAFFGHADASPGKVIAFVPAFNEENDIHVVLESLLGFKREGTIDDVVVVDSRSTDNTEKVAKKMGANVVKQQYGKGRGGAFVDGVKYCLKNKAEIILMFDADIVKPLKREQVQEMIAPVRESSVIAMVIYPPIEGNRGSDQSLWESLEFSGQRAFRASSLQFLFERKNGRLELSGSKEAADFMEAAAEYALENYLNHLFDMMGRRRTGLTKAIDKGRENLIALKPKNRQIDLLKGQVEQIHRSTQKILELMDDPCHQAFLRRLEAGLPQKRDEQGKNLLVRAIKRVF